MSGYGHKGGPKTPEGKAKALANLNPKGQLGNRGGGRIAEYIRDILREGLEEAAPKIAKVMNGEAPVPGLPDPEYGDMAKAWEFGAKHSLPELEKVVEEKFIFAVAEALAEDERIPFECIQDITDALIAKLSPQHGS
jgi:hypothetical protein